MWTCGRDYSNLNKKFLTNARSRFPLPMSRPLLGGALVSEHERRRLLDVSSVSSRAPRVGEVYDEHGRRRLHGAFTGGFSAGYFNSVGSAEGWHGSKKVVTHRNEVSKSYGGGLQQSSRRKYRQQRPEDFMDEEDDPMLAVKASEAYVDREMGNHGFLTDSRGKLGSKRNRELMSVGSRGDAEHFAREILGSLAPTKATVGSKIMQKLGWRPGQGLGPRVKVNDGGQRLLADGSVEIDMHAVGRSFAPPDMTSCEKTKFRDEGYAGLGSKTNFGTQLIIGSSTTGMGASKRRCVQNEGIGMGIFDEADIDDVDEYDREIDVGEDPVAPRSSNGKRSLDALEARLREQTAKAHQRASGDPLTGFRDASGPDFVAKAYPLPDTSMAPGSSTDLPRAHRVQFGSNLPSLSSRFVKAGAGEASSAAQIGSASSSSSFSNKHGDEVHVRRSFEEWLPVSLLAKRLGVQAAKTAPRNSQRASRDGENQSSSSSSAFLTKQEDYDGDKPHSNWSADQMRAVFDEPVQDEDRFAELSPSMACLSQSTRGGVSNEAEAQPPSIIKFRSRAERSANRAKSS